MKIVNRQAFLALPPGTLFSKFQPNFFEAMEIKGESWLQSDDYLYQSIQDAIDSTSSSEFGDRLHAMVHKGASCPMGLDSQSRDGCFDKDQLFAVWERPDVEALLARLQQALIDQGGA